MDVLALPGTTRVSSSAGGHRRCARCGKVVSRRAIVCRRCGKKQRINPRSMMLFVAGVFLLALFGLAAANPRLPFARLFREDAPPPGAPAKVAALPAGVHTITAAELWSAYGSNAAKADARFKDKRVAVTGTIVDVRRDFRGNWLLRLATGDALETVRATVVSHEYGARSLPTRGQTVALGCVGRGAAIGAPLLDACLPL